MSTSESSATTAANALDVKANALEAKANADAEKLHRMVSTDSFQSYIDHAEAVNDGIMSRALFQHHKEDGEDDDEDHPVPPGSFKAKLLRFLSHWKFEAFIVTLIVFDLLVTLLEMGLEYRFICISPELVMIPRSQIKAGISLEHEHAATSYWLGQSNETGLTSHDIPESFNVSMPYLSLVVPGMQTEAAKGAMMLQIGAGTIAKLVAGSAQPEHAHGGESEPEKAGGEKSEGHEHGHDKHGHRTLLCEGPHGERSHKFHMYCHVLGLSILGIFILELVTKAWINPYQFFRSKLQVLDLIIVSTSFILDLCWPIFANAHPDLLEAKSDLVRVIILFIRLIRVVKVMHATSEVLHKGLHYVKEMKEVIQEKDEVIEKRNEEIEKLKQALKDAKGGKSKWM